MHKKIQWLIAKLTDGTPQKMLTQLHWIYQYGRRYWKAMILYTVLGVAGTGISLVSSFISKDLVLLDFAGSGDDFTVSDEDINIGISMKKGNTELKEAIDSVLTKMTKDDFSAMMDEAISVQPLAN